MYYRYPPNKYLLFFSHFPSQSFSISHFCNEHPHGGNFIVNITVEFYNRDTDRNFAATLTNFSFHMFLTYIYIHLLGDQMCRSKICYVSSETYCVCNEICHVP